MKKISKILLLAIFISTPMRSENSLSQMLSNIKNKVVEVQVDKSSIRQSLEILNESKGKLRLTSIVVDEKGKTSKSTYEFYITDIDKNTIIRSTQGKKMFVSMSLYNKQKFVKLLIDDKPESYTNNVEIIVSETEAAQIIIDNMKSAISQIKTVDKTWTSANEALLWLKNNVKEVAIKSGSISQSLSFNEKRNYLIDLTT